MDLTEMFKDISKYDNLNDYLAIFTASVIIYIIGIFFLIIKKDEQKKLENYFENFNMGAIISDILIIVMAIIRTRFLYHFVFSEFSIIKFIGFGISVQVLRDLLLSDFYKLIPKNNTLISDLTLFTFSR